MNFNIIRGIIEMNYGFNLIELGKWKVAFKVFTEIGCGTNKIQRYKHIPTGVGNDMTDQKFFHFSVPEILHEWSIGYDSNYPTDSKGNHTFHENLSLMVIWQFGRFYFDEDVGEN